jgi:hypothetical protein
MITMFDSPATPLCGATEDVASLVETVRTRFRSKPYCIVREWTVFRADVTSEELVAVHERGHLPLILFAHQVVEDAQARFRPGDWVRSSMCVSFDGAMFETKNTVYVLIGPGFEKAASLKTIFSFF